MGIWFAVVVEFFHDVGLALLPKFFWLPAALWGRGNFHAMRALISGRNMLVLRGGGMSLMLPCRLGEVTNKLS